MKGKFLLENGYTFEGKILIDGGIKTGMVVFDTRVVGYEKVLTCPEYCGKIVCFTYPLIGNYGINYEDLETDMVFPAGIIISEYSEIYSNFRAKCSLEDFLKDKGITVIEGIDTQYITEIIRENKGIRGAIAPATADEKEIKKKMKEEMDFVFPVVDDISIEESPYIAVINRTRKSEAFLLESSGMRQVYIDSVSTSAQVKDILSKAKGIYLSSYFECITSINRTAEIIKEFIGAIPIFGAGAGYLAIVIAIGGRIAKEMVNHYGTNHPVRDIEKGRKHITEQSHSLVAEESSLNSKVRFINITDGSVEGITDRAQKIVGVAFHPEKEHISEFFSFIKGD